MRIVLALAASLIVVFAAFSLVREAQEGTPRVVVAALFDEARDLCERSGGGAEDCWERLRTIGVSAAVLDARPLQALLDRGKVLYFSAADSEKWDLAGLMSPTSPLKANSLWTRDETLFAHLSETALLRGIRVSTQAYAGVYLLALPRDFDVREFPASFDLHALRFVGRQGLVPVLRSGQFEDFLPLWNEAADKSRLSPVYLFNFLAPQGADLSGRWIAAPSHRWSGPRFFGARPRGAMTAADLGADGDPAAVFRALLGRGARLIITHFRSDRGTEENFDALRDLAARVRGAGFSLDAPLPAQDFSDHAWELWLRYWIAAFAAFLTPLAAMRQGFYAMRAASDKSVGLHAPGTLARWPGMKSLLAEASPAPEILLSMVALIGTSCAMGLCCYALLAAPEWRLGMIRAPWILWTTTLPWIVAAVLLYPVDWKAWGKRLHRPLIYVELLKAAAVGIVLAGFLFPRHCLDAVGLLAGAERGAMKMAWWLPLRWREVLVGYPCLAAGLWKYHRSLTAAGPRGWAAGGRGQGVRPLPRSPADMPAGGRGHHLTVEYRPWLLAGLLGPMGIIQVFGLSRTPFPILLAQTVWGVLIGCALALMAYGAVGLSRRARI